jgi:lactate permease
MFWHQVVNPLNNVLFSAVLAAMPIVFLFLALAVLRLKGHIAGICTLIVSLVIAIFFFGMPVKFAFLSSLYGALFGLLPIGWIVLTAVFLYNLTVKTGQFNIIKDSITTITEDRRLQALLIAFSFGAFLEAAAGFGTPVAITAAMLVGLGFNAFYAAGICLIANTAPVAFAAVGIPIITAGAVSSIDPDLVGQITGRQLGIISIFVPFWLVVIMSGWKGAKEVMPAILTAGLSYGLVIFLASNFLGPTLPGILAALISIISLITLLKYWKPQTIWKFKEEGEKELILKKHKPLVIFKAWSPFIILTILIIDWGLKPVHQLLASTNLEIPFLGLHQQIMINDSPLEVIYTFSWLSTTGTSILIAAIISAFILKIGYKTFFQVFIQTFNEMKYALVTIASFLGFAFVANWSGITPALGNAFTLTGYFFPFISPFLGWLGVLITGSDTASNALFCNLQRITAEAIDVSPVLTVAANTTGGCAAKMISPQSLVVATSSSGLAGQESNLFRFTFPHSILFAVITGIITFVMAYILPKEILQPIQGLNLPENFINIPGWIILLMSFLIIILPGYWLSQKVNSD